MNNNITLGQKGEAAVAEYLLKSGYKMLALNYRLQCGEVDLIAEKGEIVCFVEIKTRTKEYFGTTQVITKSKQLKIIKTAQKFIFNNKISNKVFRFDVAIVIPSKGLFEIRYLPNAFTS